MQDIIGNEIQVGDVVGFARHGLQIGIIIRFTKMRVEVRYVLPHSCNHCADTRNGEWHSRRKSCYQQGSKVLTPDVIKIDSSLVTMKLLRS
jgi:hypothetical protein